MGLIDALNISSAAMFANQTGIQVTGHNIANVNTPGYTRQETLLKSNRVTYGVEATVLRNAIDGALASRIQQQQSETSYAEARAGELESLEGVVGTIGEDGLSAFLNELFSSMRSLSASPQDSVARSEVLARAENLAAEVRRRDGDLDTIQDGLDTRVSNAVARANQLLSEVASLNREVVRVTAGSESRDGLDVSDQRDQAVRELSELIGATSFETDDGTATVIVGGLSLVQGFEHRALSTTPNATTGLNDVTLADGTAGSLNARIEGGQLGAYLQLRDTDVVNQRDNLDQFAFDLATAFNAQHQSNFGLDGVSGRDFFSAPGAVSGAAGGLSLDSALVGQPDRLGVAQNAASLPGDARGLQNMIDIEGANVASGGTTTLHGALRDIVSSVGQSTRLAKQDADRAESSLSYLDSLRESQAGVSIEEEVLALNRFQRGFQAASRVVSTVDELLGVVINM